MTELTAPFAPDWVSPPGDSILDIAEERGWTQAELAQRLGYTEKHVSQLINGKVPLSVDAALRFVRHQSPLFPFSFRTRQCSARRGHAATPRRR